MLGGGGGSGDGEGGGGGGGKRRKRVWSGGGGALGGVRTGGYWNCRHEEHRAHLQNEQAVA